MSRNSFQERQHILELVLQYEDPARQGTVDAMAETDFLQLIKYFQDESLTTRAMDVVETALHRYHDTSRFYLRKADLLIDNRQEELAMLELERAERVGNETPELLLLRIRALSRLEQYDTALDLVERLKATDEAVALSRAYHAEALVYYDMKQHERAFFLLQTALHHQRDNEEVLQSLWLCVEISRRHEESVELHEALLDEHPYTPMAWYNLGQSYQYLCEYDKAIHAFETAYLINENFEFAYRECAEVSLFTQNYAQALKCFQGLLDNFGPDYLTLLNMGKCSYHLGHYAPAKTFLSQALAIDPYEDEVHFYIGQCYARCGQYERAIAKLNEAVAIEEQREEYYAALAEVYYKLGRYDEADEYFAEATSVGPEFSEYWIRYALFKVELGEDEAALEQLDCGDLNCGAAELRYARVAVLLQIDRRAEGLETLGDALLHDYTMHPHLFDLMPCLREDKEVKALVKTFEPYE